VVDVYATSYNYAALHSDGSVTAWENDLDGYSDVISDLDGTNPVVSIYSAWNTYAALHSDGSVTTWGSSSVGGNSSAVSSDLDGTNPVVSITLSTNVASALHSDGSVTTWGAIGTLPGGAVGGSTKITYDNYDTDLDSISNADELASCTIPYSTAIGDLGNPPCQSAGNPDSDGDGVWDNLEIMNGTSPLKATYLHSEGDANIDSMPDNWISFISTLNVPIFPN
jgi:hypothetical protein